MLQRRVVKSVNRHDTRGVVKRIGSSVLAILVALSLCTLTPLGTVFSLLPGGEPIVRAAYAARTDHPENISTITDTLPAGGSRTFLHNGTQMYNATTYWGNANNGVPNNLGVDPLNNPYMLLAPNNPSTFGYAIYQEKISATDDFHVQGYFKVDRLVNDGRTDTGDWIGIVFLPVNDTSTLANVAGQGGGGLGMASVPNALGFGIDMHRNPEFLDPGAGPFASLRWTGSNGTLQPLGDRVNLYSVTQDMRNWSTANIQYTMNYYYNNGDPYITITLDDRGNDGHVWSASTLAAGGSTNRLYITPPAQGYFTIAMDGANGSSRQRFVASWGQMSGTHAYGTAAINYLVDPNVVPGGGTVAPSTRLKSNLGDVIAVRETLVGTPPTTADIHTYLGSTPQTAYAPYQSGWHPTRSRSTNDGNSYLTMNIDNTKNIFNVYYAPDFQFARLFTDSTDPLGGGQNTEVDNIAGVTGGAMTGWKLTDANLAREGKVYTVKAPNGQTYPTLSAARAAVNTFDATSNGADQSDKTPQDFYVTYTNALQQAIVNGVTNGVTSTIATYDNTTNATTGTPNHPLEEGTSGELKSNVNDEALAKPGYDYTVTGPNGTTYSTMQTAWAANNTWDLTNNPAGATVDSAPQVWTVNYTGHQQTATLEQFSADGRGPSGTVQTVTGTSGTPLSFMATDATLATQGYSYIVELDDGTGSGEIAGSYASLQAALAANPVFDATNNPAPATVDASPQTFRVVYTAGKATVRYHYVDESGAILRAETANQQVVNAVIAQDNPPDIQGYVFKELGSASDQNMLVNADGTSLVVYVYEIDPAIIAAAEKAITDAQGSDVSNETAVQEAITAVQEVLVDDTATPQEIQEATKALNDAVATATTERSNALSDANAALTDAKDSAYVNDPGVVAAQEDLQDMLDNPGNFTTEQIKDATAALNDAVAQAAQNKADALEAANAAKDPDALHPVTHEPDVAAALTALNDAIANGSAEEMTSAAAALTGAVSQAQSDRSDANNAAGTAVTNAQNSTAAQDSAVQHAIENLQKIQEAAAADSPNDLTKDIIDATQVLNDAVTNALAGQATARSNADAALVNTSPVSHETEVANAITDLNTVLSNSNATQSEIQNAVEVLQEATKSANDDRTTATKDADHVIGSLTQDDVDAQSVRDARDTLLAIMAQAANDDPDALTQDILNATDSLIQAMIDSDAQEHAAAVNAATDLIESAKPVTHEEAVADALEVLSEMISDNDNHTTEEIQEATAALQEALDDAKPERDAANSKANGSIAAAQASSVADTQNVKDAITALQQAQEQAAADSDSVLTADIIALADALDAAVTQAQADRQAVRDAATTAISNAAPVSHESNVADAISNLNTVLEDPSATDAQINAATQALNGEVKTAENERNWANAAANSRITQAEASPVHNEGSIVNAIEALQNVMTAAAADSATDLTEDILTAITNLADAQKQAQDARNAASNTANTAITAANTSNVYNEPDVITARDALQTMLDNPGSYTTEEITQATTALDTAVSTAQGAREDAREAAEQAVTDATESPLIKEPSVYEKESNLQNLLNNPEATTEQIEEATEALRDAETTASSNKDAALEDAKSKLANTEALVADPQVADARDTLQEMVDNPNNYTTEQITDATTTLENITELAFDKDLVIAAAKEAQDPHNTAPVSHEPEVALAIDNLDSLIESSTSTAWQITDATNALNDAIAAARTARDEAKDEAATAISTAQNDGAISQEQQVVDAIAALEEALLLAENDDKDYLTADIEKLTDELNEAVADARSIWEATVENALQEILPENTTPVTYEPEVIQEGGSLQDMIDDLWSSGQINDQLQDFVDTVQTARDDRTEAVDSAQSLIDAINASDSGLVPEVRSATDGLVNEIAHAQQNSPDHLTEHIENATQALQDAQQNAQKAREAAAQAIENAHNSPFPNHPLIVGALDALQKLLDNPASSTADINKAVFDLNSAVERSQVSQTEPALVQGSAGVTPYTGDAFSTHASLGAALALTGILLLLLAHIRRKRELRQ